MTLRSLILISILLALAAMLAGQTTTPQPKADYAQTLRQLLPLAEGGRHNADLYYNIGVCYYHLGQPGRAALWWLRAQNLDSSHRQARENLAWLAAYNGDAIKAPERPFLVQLLFNIYDFFSLNRLAAIFLILGLLCTLSALWLMHYPLDQEHGLPVLVLGITLLLLLTSGGALWQKNRRHRHNDKAVILQEAAPFYGSNTEARPAQFLPEASIVEVKQTGQLRSQLILPDGRIGWVDNAALERVVPQRATARRSIKNEDLPNPNPGSMNNGQS